MRNILIILSALLSLTACDPNTPSNTTNTNPSAPDTTAATTNTGGGDVASDTEQAAAVEPPVGAWSLVTMGGAEPIEGTGLGIDFKSDGSVGGDAGCNAMGGGVKFEGNTLTFDGLGITEMACEGVGILEQESAYFEAVRTSTGWEMRGEQLVLTGSKVELVFERAQAPKGAAAEAPPLEGTSWAGTTRLRGNTAESMPAGIEPPLTLQDGGFSGSTGCNRINGTYTVEGNTITFTVGSMTKRGCPGERATFETEYVEALGQFTTWSIEGELLTLSTASGDAFVFRAQKP